MSAATYPTAFDFTGAASRDGFVTVAKDTPYTRERGYGFEVNPGPTPDTNVAKLFSVAVPEGNYDVTLTFGATDAATTNTIKTESRRLMLENVITRPGEFVTRTITVNVRGPQIPGGDRVRLKERERGVLHWDDKLTVEFNGTQPGVSKLTLQPALKATTVFLLGDSTVTDQPYEPWNSWGQMLTRFFQPGVAVANYAESGESLKSSLSARRVAKVLATVRDGDYVFVQFGHNDQKDKATNALAAYETNQRALLREVRAKGATPVLVVSMERKGGLKGNTLAGYPDTVRRLAAEEKVPVIDLQAMSLALYRALGPEMDLAFQDGTHHNNFGSYELAKCVAEGIRDNSLPLAQMLATDFKGFDPARPDAPGKFFMPPSPMRSELKPDGN